MERANLENIVIEIEKKADRVRGLNTIYNNLYDKMQLECCSFNTDENGKLVYKEPSEEEYEYEMFLAYQEVLKVVEKLATK